MLNKELFQKPKNTLEQGGENASHPNIPGRLCISCSKCKKILFAHDLEKSFFKCPKCGHLLHMSARERIAMMTDKGSFSELFGKLRSKNILDFPDYNKKLSHSFLSTHEREGVVCGIAQICQEPCAIFVMDPNFMMGSMGTVVGEKITRLFEYATENHLPVVGWTVSGGARMQEGILSLMQMAKTSGAVKLHSDAGLLYIVVLTDPTTGGVTASFAMEADIILAEPQALIGFAGPRVIKQTIRQKLPAGFQRSEFLLEKGFVDALSNRETQKEQLSNFLSLHHNEEADSI
ncbi:acetyl-CoA carboxylase, carboxyltransferase subunit beta [Caproicibacterium sp. BJN0003]|uniref:acetyl-CoA carboxylase, carboxyltransferase subunit beta n=1 Tax=Caproicibacterium sp. BJN0003 TaxID=2994078 RepID=UPI00225A5A91|nr:acetyl-CoA carboxylase, carboxyltransferase subunit beta [Caproicibacterium sp. BJN0003]UZT82061.1 acetyl-CoA carboxylase, carboxyltransferase subunit beta [Caproicibacterium sp. BJN0003]